MLESLPDLAVRMQAKTADRRFQYNSTDELILSKHQHSRTRCPNLGVQHLAQPSFQTGQQPSAVGPEHYQCRTLSPGLQVQLGTRPFHAGPRDWSPPLAERSDSDRTVLFGPLHSLPFPIVSVSLIVVKALYLHRIAGTGWEM